MNNFKCLVVCISVAVMSIVLDLLPCTLSQIFSLWLWCKDLIILFWISQNLAIKLQLFTTLISMSCLCADVFCMMCSLFGHSLLIKINLENYMIDIKRHVFEPLCFEEKKYRTFDIFLTQAQHYWKKKEDVVCRTGKN